MQDKTETLNCPLSIQEIEEQSVPSKKTLTHMGSVVYSVNHITMKEYLTQMIKKTEMVEVILS